MSESRYRFEDQLPANSKAVLQACREGGLEKLQQICEEDDNMKPKRIRPTWWDDPNARPDLDVLIQEAVTYEHIPILRYLMCFVSDSYWYPESLVHSLVKKRNLEILEVIRTRSPSIVNYEFDSTETFLTEACRGGPEYHRDNLPGDEGLPLIHYLLDNGALPTEGSWAGSGAMPGAIEFGRPLEIIDKMIEKGAVVNLLTFTLAIRNARIDALQLFFDKALFSLDAKTLYERGRETKNRQVRAAVIDAMRKHGYIGCPNGCRWKLTRYTYIYC